MAAVRPELLSATLAEAVEANVVAFSLLLARPPHGEVHDEHDVLWYATALPHSVFNGVLRADLAHDTLETRIEQVLAHFRRRNAALTWCLGPSTRPLNLGEYLRAHGMYYSGNMPGMAIDLQARDLELPKPAGLYVERVRCTAGLRSWLQPVADGFDFGGEVARAVFGAYEALGLGAECALQHYVGRLYGEVVASASLFLSAGVAGLYCIATLPYARGRGIGSAMTRAALHDARARGYRWAALYSTEMGFDVYRQIGFDTCCQFSFYNWPAPDY